jgi:molybdopterin molybdotransferase
VRKRGEDAHDGQLIVAQGTRLNAAHVGLLAMQGLDRVSVFRQLRVGILTTGDELVGVGNPKGRQQVFDSNGPMLSALAQGMGALVNCTLHVRDNLFETRSALAHLAARSDVVISAGGVSVGEKDFLYSALDSLGGTMELLGVRMKPGKPFSVGYIFGKPVICLPGNPGAAYAVFALMASPILRRMQGRSTLFPVTSIVSLQGGRRGSKDRDDFVRVANGFSPDRRQLLVPLEQQSPGTVSSLATASGLARIRPGSVLVDGDAIEYYDFNSWLI